MITLAALAALLPGMAAAQANCADRAEITDRLAEKYGETFAGGGLRSSNAIYEVWFSAEKGTWTILMTRPDGKSCVMAAGTDWREALPSERIAGIPG